MKHAISWFELPATDVHRATAFYAAILQAPLGEVTEADGRRFAMFQAEDGVSGAVVEGDGYEPSADGALVFLNAGDVLQPVVDRVEPAGGRVLLPRMDMGDWGVAAFIVDTEGNKVAPPRAGVDGVACSSVGAGAARCGGLTMSDRSAAGNEGA